jgi:PAT family beta-lactamase induction signal transducer AmpG
MVLQALPATMPPSLALSEHRHLRMATLFLLYVAQGLPLGLMEFALPAWMAQSGASAAAIGAVLAALMLPWTFKLAYGFLMDRYAFLAMGRRRPWIIVSQFALVASLIAMAVADPGAAQVGALTAFAFLLGLSSAAQDVATDGLAVDILPPDEIERTNGVMFGGQAIGISAGAALGGYLLASSGLPAAAMVLAVILAAILALVCIVRERPEEKLLPWSRGMASQRNLDLHVGALWPIIRDLFAALFTRETLILMPAFMAASAAYGLFLGLAPLFSADVLGWEKAVYSGWSGQATLLAGIAGGLVFGAAAGRWGSRRMYIVGSLGFAVIGIAMTALGAYWHISALFILSIFGVALMRTLNLVTGGSLGMRLCLPAIAATQFAMFMAIANVGKVLASASLGWLDNLGGLPAMFAAVGVCGLTAAAFAALAKVGR